MRYIRLLVGSIIAIGVGLLLWFLVGPIVAISGVSSHFEGWWIFGETVTDVTPAFWVGIGLSVIGAVVTVGGVVGVVLSLILEFLKPKPQSNISPVKGQTTVFCTHCGNPLSPNSEYCSKCGEKVQT